jgi:hypothetical protein
VQTHRTWLALKLTDPPFQVQGVSVIEVRNALSLATSTIMDAATIMKQVGVLPKA